MMTITTGFPALAAPGRVLQQVAAIFHVEDQC
jgi:hypothetical protein